jgi:hypothetical protein
MDTTGDVSAQLVAELAEKVTEPLGGLLGGGEAPRLRKRLEGAQRRIVRLLEAGGDDARLAAARIVGLLWGRAEPTPAWWSTPLGRLTGPLLEDAPVTEEFAAAILGVKRGTVAVLLRRGTLARFPEARPEGGPGRPTTKRQVSRAAVLERLARLQPPDATAVEGSADREIEG